MTPSARRQLAYTSSASLSGLQFLHPIKVGDLIILRARVTAVWSTSLEVHIKTSRRSGRAAKGPARTTNIP